MGTGAFYLYRMPVVGNYVCPIDTVRSMFGDSTNEGCRVAAESKPALAQNRLPSPGFLVRRLSLIRSVLVSRFRVTLGP